MASSTQARPSTPVRIPVEVWRVAAVIIVGSFMSTLNSSLINVGLNTISRDLSVPLAQVQWVISGYLIAFAAVLPISAWLSGRIGAGRLWLIALAGFTVSSGLCSLAPNLPMLVALRVLQGVTGALLVPTGQTVVGHLAGPERMGRVLNSTKVVSFLAPVVGPVIGGLIISGLSWRWLFLVNVPIGAIAFVVGLRLVPHGTPDTARGFDLPGFVLVMVGLPMTIFGVSALGQQARGLDTGWIVAILLVGLVVLALFARRALRIPHPVLDLRLFTNRVYTAAATSVFFTGAALLGVMVLFPLYFQLIRHQSVLESGLSMLAIGLGAALSMPFGGVLTDRIGGGVISAAGIVASALSVVPLLFLRADADLILVEVCQVITGFGLGLASMPALSVAYATVPRDKLAHATSEANIIQRVGGSIGATTLVVAIGNHGVPNLRSFQVACGWLVGGLTIAVVLAGWLLVEERRLHRNPASVSA